MSKKEREKGIRGELDFAKDQGASAFGRVSAQCHAESYIPDEPTVGYLLSDSRPTTEGRYGQMNVWLCLLSSHISRTYRFVFPQSLHNRSAWNRWLSSVHTVCAHIASHVRGFVHATQFFSQPGGLDFVDNTLSPSGETSPYVSGNKCACIWLSFVGHDGERFAFVGPLVLFDKQGHSCGDDNIAVGNLGGAYQYTTIGAT